MKINYDKFGYLYILFIFVSMDIYVLQIDKVVN